MKRNQSDTRRNPKRHCKRDKSLPMGNFSEIPEEITQLIFSEYTTLKGLATLSMTSKPLCNYIRELAIDSQMVIRPISVWIDAGDKPKIKQRFIEIGMLLRTTSAFLTTTEKLKVIEVFLYELEDTYHKICERLSLKFAYDCVGEFLYKYIIGWQESWLVETFHLINRLSRLNDRLDKVMLSKAGEHRHYERDVRQFIQEVFLAKAVSPDQRALWLSLIMAIYPGQHARLLYLLYGPVQVGTEGMIAWKMLTQCANYGHITCPYSNFKDIADIIGLISSSNRFRWNNKTIIKFFGELTCTPEPWCLENTAKLMFMLGHNMTVTILQNKLKMDMVSEYSHLAYHLAQVSTQSSPEGSPESLLWFTKVMFESIRVLEAPSRRSNVITEVFRAWRDNAQALTEELDDPMDEEDVRDDLRITVVNLASLAHLLMEMILVNKDPSPFIATTPRSSRHEE